MHAKSFSGIYCRTPTWPPDPARPTLVFIHGSGGDGSLWDGQLRDLADAANAVALDLPGHGNSPGPGLADVASYAAAVRGFVRAAGLPRPTPCGLSIGGAVTLQLLLDYPEEMAGGILVSTGARLRVDPAIFASIAEDYPRFLEQLPDRAVSRATPRERIPPLLKAMAATPPGVTAGDFHACDGFDVMDRLGEIRHPVLVITAEDDLLTPPK